PTTFLSPSLLQYLSSVRLQISVYVSPPFPPPHSIPSFNIIFMREPISFHLPLFLLLYKSPPPRISLRSTFYDLFHLMVLHDMSLNPNQAVVGKLSENDWGVQAIVSWVLAEVFGTQNLSIVAEEDTDSLSKSESLGLLDSVSNAVNEALSEARKYGLPKPDKPLGSHDILKAIGRCNSTGGPKGRHWVLDPVDGTLGFVRGDQYAVALALIEDGKVLLGVLGCPNYSVKKEVHRRTCQ
ncbi:hypothetical protein HID58_012118, partial [Brassica napus]